MSNKVVCLFSAALRGILKTKSDKFETVCSVQADISTAPYQTRQGNTGGVSYKRAYEVILLVGLTELKAQIAWIDSVTVSAQRIQSCSPILTPVTYGCRKWRKGLVHRSLKCRVPKAEFLFQE